MADETGKQSILTEAKMIDGESVTICLNRNYALNLSKPVSQLPGGTENAAWVIEANEGKWIAKIFGSGEGPIERIQEEATLYRFLNSQGIHAPEILSNKSGQDLSLLESRDQTLQLMLMKYEQLTMCSPVTVTQAELEKIARETAKMHEVLVGCPQADSLKKEVRVPFDKGATFEALVSSAYKSEFTQEQLQRIKKINDQIENYLESHPPPESLTKTVIHADLSLEHAQLLPDGGVYFFDFSDRTWGPVTQELGTFLTVLFQWEDVSLQRWGELRSWVMSGYLSESTLTEDDIQAINFFILSRILGACKYLIDLTRQTPNETVVSWVKRGYQLGEHVISQT